MTEMLNAFFMRYAVGEAEITIYPRPELEHILGRPTAKQLELLKAIYTKPIMIYYLDEEQKAINMALSEEVLISPIHVLGQLNNLFRQLVGEAHILQETRKGTWTVKESRETGKEEGEDYRLPTPATLVQLLSQVNIDRQNLVSARWYITGSNFANHVPEIRVVHVYEFRQAKLDQVVDISFKDEKAEIIIQRLANWTGMELYMNKRDPAWLSESISVEMQNVKLKQAIVNVVTSVDGETQISYNSNFISIEGPKHPKPRQAKPRKTPGKSNEGYVGKVSIPMDGGKYFIEFMLREKDLTDELKKLRDEKIKEILPKGGGGKSGSPKPAAKPKN